MTEMVCTNMTEIIQEMQDLVYLVIGLRYLKKINISLRRIQRRIQNLHVQKFPAGNLKFYYR